jgi:hypothetical protein
MFFVRVASKELSSTASPFDALTRWPSSVATKGFKLTVRRNFAVPSYPCLGHYKA